MIPSGSDVMGAPARNAARLDRAGEDGSGLSVLKDANRERSDDCLREWPWAEHAAVRRNPYGAGRASRAAAPPTESRSPSLDSAPATRCSRPEGVLKRHDRQHRNHRAELDTLRQLTSSGATIRACVPRQRRPGAPLVHGWPALLRKGDRRYDIIEADALRPTSAYAQSFSVEDFELLRAHLNPEASRSPGLDAAGLTVSSRRFPMCLASRGRRQAVKCHEFDRTAINSRMQDPFMRDYYARGGIAPTSRRYYAQEKPGGARMTSYSELVDLNRHSFEGRVRDSKDAVARLVTGALSHRGGGFLQC